MRNNACYRIRKSEALFEEMNTIALQLKRLRDMVTSSKSITKQEWDEFLFTVDEVKSNIDAWRDKVVRLKKITTEEAVKPLFFMEDVG